MKIKLLCIKNIDNNNVPIVGDSNIFTKLFKNKNDALKYGNEFLQKNKDSYIKIWNTNTNEIIFETRNNNY